MNERSDDITEHCHALKRYVSKGNSLHPDLIEVAFKGGSLLPEEFLDIVRSIFREQRIVGGKDIRRVVLDDISLIGVSYPLLRESKTAGELFLPSFVHIIRNYSAFEKKYMDDSVGFYMGPYADELLKSVADIHEGSIARSSIKDYKIFRTFLTAIGQQLSYLPKKGDEGPDARDFIRRSYQRIPDIITGVFSGKSGQK